MSGDDRRRPSEAYKVFTADEMATLERDGQFAGSEADCRDGYIHLSTADQLTGTVDRHYAGQSDLHVAAVDLAAQGSSIRWETARNGSLFPHLYGVLRLDTVTAQSPLDRDEAGRVRLPFTAGHKSPNR